MPHVLKRLELNGFKSFAERTTFDFPEGITAIVGPNGSGKSNVIDAIRWLLGERDAKNLRGGKAEDLIFAGTAKRPRLGQAQAALYFRNDTKFFPLDFSEISVSREVTRDGASRYFLNKSEVRLKDVVDFFAKARLGARGFVVVTQGNSDMFIRATPTERREMIEEILGLREYQLKREEAERRLRNTEVNLEKGKALVLEILPHLRSLKRQTNRWEKRSELEKELRELEDRFFGVEYRELRKGVAAVEREFGEREKELDKLRGAKQEAEDRLKNVEAGEPLERRELAEIKKRTQSLLEKKGELQKELGRLEAQLEMKSERSEAAPASQALLALVKNVRNKLSGLGEIEYEDLQHAIREIIEDIDEVLGDSRGRTGAVAVDADLEARLRAITDEIGLLEEELRGHAEKEKAIGKGQEHFYADFKAAVAAVEAAKDHIERWEIAHQKGKFEKERLEMRLEEWERQVKAAGREPKEFFEAELPSSSAAGDREAAERRMFKLRGDLAAMGEIDEALLKEVRETGVRYEFLSKECEDLEKAKGGLKKLIEDLRVKIKTEFGSAITEINKEFDTFFKLMFGGGQAKLKVKSERKKVVGENGEAAVPEEDAGEEEGVEIDLKLPRKRVTSIDTLSGGERSLVGIAALFAMISVSPPPFLVLDEVDAALDERNARRFSEMLREFSKKTQFVLVTHNRATMEVADVLYGITMNDDATSKVVSLKLEPQGT